MTTVKSIAELVAAQENCKMNLCDKIIRNIQKIEAYRAEIEIIEKILLKESYRDEEHEDNLRMQKVVKLGRVEVIKNEVSKELKRYLRQ